MSLFDFFFPEVAQAQELRRIANSTSLTAVQSRLSQARMNHQKSSAEGRIRELEDEVAQLTIILEALIEHLSEGGGLSREQLASKIAEIDMRDGVADGKITKHLPTAEEESKQVPKFIFPE